MEIFRDWIQLVLLTTVLHGDGSLVAGNNTYIQEQGYFQPKRDWGWDNYDCQNKSSPLPTSDQSGSSEVLILAICSVDGSPGISLELPRDEFLKFSDCLCNINTSTCTIDLAYIASLASHFVTYIVFSYPSEDQSFQCGSFNTTYLICTSLGWDEEMKTFERLYHMCTQDERCTPISVEVKEIFTTESSVPTPVTLYGFSTMIVVQLQGNITCGDPGVASDSTTTATTVNTTHPVNNVSESDSSFTYIIIGAITALVVSIFLAITTIVVIKMKRKSAETDKSSSSRSGNSSGRVRRNSVGNIQREPKAINQCFRGRSLQLSQPWSSPASIATSQSPFMAAGNRTGQSCSEMPGDSASRGDSFDRTPNPILPNTFAQVSDAGGIGNGYSSLDELTKYSHLYNKVSVGDPHLRPAMPLPPQVLNQPRNYYSVAQPTTGLPTNEMTAPATSEYVELIDESEIINQPISLDGYLTPVTYPPMDYENTSHPNTYESLISTND